MGKKVDITGQKFGHLTVLRDTGKRSKSRQVIWECQCDCENHTIVEVVGQALRDGHTTSCGCSRKGKNIKDLTNQRFGSLIVIRQDFVDNNRKVHWICKCDCGIEFSASGEELRNGKRTACPECTKKALKYKISSYEKIHNHRFGLLTPLYPTDKRNSAGRIYWLCKCDCGNETLVPSSALLSSNTKSCGCLRHNSIGELEIETLLKEAKINFIREYTASDLKSPKGGVLRFDFALYDNNANIIRFIEFDGIQHTQIVDYFNGEEGFKYLQQCDEIKNQYAKQHHIPLIRIPYTKKDKIILSDLLESTYEI